MATSVRGFQLCRGCYFIFRRNMTLTSSQRYYNAVKRLPIHTKLARRSCVPCVRFCQTAENEETGPVTQTTIDEEEREKFRLLSSFWWNELGEFQALHTMNELRVPMIRDALVEDSGAVLASAVPLKDMQILDAGCGGGLLTEPLARLGAEMTSVDMVEDNIRTAQVHLEQDPAIIDRVKYIQAAIEDLVGSEEGKFDAVVASEVVEHVSDLSSFVSSCSLLLKPGGSLFITTINKTQLSRGLAVFGAEKVLRLVPEGTHDWHKFVPPEDLQYMLESNGLTVRLIHGLLYNPVTCRWSWVKDTSMNYALHAVKGDNSFDGADSGPSLNGADSGPTGTDEISEENVSEDGGTSKDPKL